MVPTFSQQQPTTNYSIPRVFVKNDIRRSYAQMFANVSNSFNSDLVATFFHTFSRIDMDFQENNTIIQSTEYDADDMPQSLTLNGLPVVVQFWLNRMHAIPDGVIKMSDAKVTTFPNSKESQITCLFEFAGTRLFDVPHTALIPTEEQSEKLRELKKQQDDTVIDKKRKMDTVRISKLNTQQKVDFLSSDEPNYDKTHGQLL